MMNRKRFGLRTRKRKTSKVLEAIQKDQKERFSEGECFSTSSCAGSVQSKSSFASSAQSSRASTSSASSRRSTASSAFRKRREPDSAFGVPTGLSQLWEDGMNHNEKRSTSDEFFLDGLLVIAPDRENSLEDLLKNDDRNASDFFLP